MAPPTDPPAPLVERMGPPISRSPWSPDFAVQALEVLPVFIDDGALSWLKPVHAGSLQVGLPKGVKPAELVLEVIAWYPLRARVVHSTSWRDEDRIVLTYLVVVDPPDDLPPDSLTRLPVERAELARGEATAAPGAIRVAAVIEHALRHLKWLIGDDPAVALALPDWASVLADYQPEPFRPL